MQTVTVKIDNATLARLQRSATREVKTLNAAILEGIVAYIEGEEEAWKCETRDAFERRFQELSSGSLN